MDRKADWLDALERAARRAITDVRSDERRVDLPGARYAINALAQVAHDLGLNTETILGELDRLPSAYRQVPSPLRLARPTKPYGRQPDSPLPR